MRLFKGSILNDAMKIKHCVMKVVFLVLQSFPEIESSAANCACKIVQYFLKQLFTDDLQVRRVHFIQSTLLCKHMSLD